MGFAPNHSAILKNEKNQTYFLYIPLMKILIRDATTKDLLSIQILMDTLNDSRDKNFSKQNKSFHKRTKEYSKLKKSDIKNDIFAVAENYNQIIGFARGSIHKKNHTPNHPWDILSTI